MRLRVSAKGMRIIDKRGIDAVLVDIRLQRRQGLREKIMRELIRLVSSAWYSATSTPPTRTSAPPRTRSKSRNYDPVVRKHVIYKEAKIK